MKNKTKVLLSIFGMAIISIFISEYCTVSTGFFIKLVGLNDFLV